MSNVQLKKIDFKILISNNQGTTKREAIRTCEKFIRNYASLVDYKRGSKHEVKFFLKVESKNVKKLFTSLNNDKSLSVTIAGNESLIHNSNLKQEPFIMALILSFRKKTDRDDNIFVTTI
jgi:hypothetical protein